MNDGTESWWEQFVAAGKNNSIAKKIRKLALRWRLVITISFWKSKE